MNNKNLKEYKKCQNDVVYFAENYFKITTIGNGLITIKLHDYQKNILNTFQSSGKNIIIKAPRQAGKGITSLICLLHYKIFNRNKNICIMAPKPVIEMILFDRINVAFKYLPSWMKIGMDGISCDNFLCSDLVYIDEYAYFGEDKVKELLLLKSIKTKIDALLNSRHENERIRKHCAELLEGCCNHDNKKMIVTSTPNGTNHFSDLYNETKRNETDFIAIDVKWQDMPCRDIKWKNKMMNDIGIKSWKKEFECEFINE